MNAQNHSQPLELGAAGVKAFFRVTRDWHVTDDERRLLLGHLGRAAFESLKKEGSPERLPEDTVNRLSYILGIHKGLAILFSPENQAHWLKTPNHDAPFNGCSPLDHMLSGRIEAMREVRRYLDAARG
jgi:hypothetical protein